MARCVSINIGLQTRIQMKESFRQVYNSSFLSRDSKSVSPSTGRLHKQRESFGPTVCLINKNTQSTMDEQNDKLYILMLILQVERLNRILGNIASSQKILNEEGQISNYKKTIKDLKWTVENSEKQKYEEIEKQNKVIYSYSNKISEYETQLKINNRKFSQLQQYSNDLQEKVRQLEQDLARARVQASRAVLNYQLNTSQSQLQKSMIKQKTAMEMEVWKQKLNKYEDMINEQKKFINNQKYTIDKLQNTELEIRQRYEYDISILKKNNQQLIDRVQIQERQYNARINNNSSDLVRQIKNKQNQIQALKQKISQERQKHENSKTAIDEIAKLTVENQQMKILITELKQTLEQLNRDFIKQSKQYEKIKIQNASMIKQISALRKQQHINNTNYSSKINDLHDQLSSKEFEIQRLQQNTRKLKNQRKIEKSYSETNIKSNYNLKNSSTDLQAIIQDVMELQNSNSRMNRLIESRSKSQVLQGRDFVYSQYGM